MKFPYKYKTVEYLGEHIIIPVDEDLFNDRVLMSLNSFGCGVIESMKEDKTEEEILTQLKNQFDGDEEELEKTFYDFLERLIRKQLVK